MPSFVRFTCDALSVCPRFTPIRRYTPLTFVPANIPNMSVCSWNMYCPVHDLSILNRNDNIFALERSSVGGVGHRFGFLDFECF